MVIFLRKKCLSDPIWKLQRSALQTLHKISSKAREQNYFEGGPSHEWVNYYDKKIESDRSCLNEWHAMDNLESRRPPSPNSIRTKPTEREEAEMIIRSTLKEIMMSVDLDEVTSKCIRNRLEEDLNMNLNEFKSFIDQEIITILGQMDAPTEIFDHVYLGSEWNASNFEELQKNGVGHILNVTREIDNFFPGMFDYLNIRVLDDEKTDLLKHWDNTFKYITKAKNKGSKVLVHCKMGVSRSASVVIAYAMKAYNWDFKKALTHVKDKRNCIKPNKSFIMQLETYQGILDAMKNKDKLQRSKSETNLKNQETKSEKKASEVSESNRNFRRESKNVIPIKHISVRSKSWSPEIRSPFSETSPIPIFLSLENLNQPQLRRKNLTAFIENARNVLMPLNNGQSYSVSPNQIVHIPGSVKKIAEIKGKVLNLTSHFEAEKKSTEALKVSTAQLNWDPGEKQENIIWTSSAILKQQGISENLKNEVESQKPPRSKFEAEMTQNASKRKLFEIETTSSRSKIEGESLRCEALSFKNESLGPRNEVLGVHNEVFGIRNEVFGPKGEVMSRKSEALGPRSEVLGLKSEVFESKGEVLTSDNKTYVSVSETSGFKDELELKNEFMELHYESKSLKNQSRSLKNEVLSLKTQSMSSRCELSVKNDCLATKSDCISIKNDSTSIKSNTSGPKNDTISLISGFKEASISKNTLDLEKIAPIFGTIKHESPILSKHTDELEKSCQSETKSPVPRHNDKIEVCKVIVRKEGDPFSNRVDKVFDREERKSSTKSTEEERKCPSRQSSWSSYDSAVVLAYHGENRETPSRHSSWGSGDTRTLPSRNSSWGSYDMRKSHIGQTITEKEVLSTSSSGIFPYDEIPWYPGTVKRTKQKLENSEAKKNGQSYDNSQSTPSIETLPDLSPKTRTKIIHYQSSPALCSKKTSEKLETEDARLSVSAPGSSNLCVITMDFSFDPTPTSKTKNTIDESNFGLVKNLKKEFESKTEEKEKNLSQSPKIVTENDDISVKELVGKYEIIETSPILRQKCIFNNKSNRHSCIEVLSSKKEQSLSPPIGGDFEKPRNFENQRPKSAFFPLNTQSVNSSLAQNIGANPLGQNIGNAGLSPQNNLLGIQNIPLDQNSGVNIPLNQSNDVNIPLGQNSAESSTLNQNSGNVPLSQNNGVNTSLGLNNGVNTPLSQNSMNSLNKNSADPHLNQSPSMNTSLNQNTGVNTPLTHNSCVNTPLKSASPPYQNSSNSPFFQNISVNTPLNQNTGVNTLLNHSTGVNTSSFQKDGSSHLNQNNPNLLLNQNLSANNPLNQSPSANSPLTHNTSVNTLSNSHLNQILPLPQKFSLPNKINASKNAAVSPKNSLKLPLSPNGQLNLISPVKPQRIKPINLNLPLKSPNSPTKNSNSEDSISLMLSPTKNINLSPSELSPKMSPSSPTKNLNVSLKNLNSEFEANVGSNINLSPTKNLINLGLNPSCDSKLSKNSPTKNLTCPNKNPSLNPILNNKVSPTKNLSGNKDINFLKPQPLSSFVKSSVVKAAAKKQQLKNRDLSNLNNVKLKNNSHNTV